jgi:hypothetical protein
MNQQIIFLDTVHPILEQRLTTQGYTCIQATTESLEACLPLLKTAHGIVIRSRFTLNE